MKRILAIIIGLSCCAGTVSAAAPNLDRKSPALTPAGYVSPERAYLSGDEGVFFESIAPRKNTSREDLADLAYKISYIGSLLLTADSIVRSVDSVLESMKITREDGTRLRMIMEPRARGFEVVLKLSRPLDF